MEVCSPLPECVWEGLHLERAIILLSQMRLQAGFMYLLTRRGEIVISEIEGKSGRCYALLLPSLSMILNHSEFSIF